MNKAELERGVGASQHVDDTQALLHSILVWRLRLVAIHHRYDHVNAAEHVEELHLALKKIAGKIGQRHSLALRFHDVSGGIAGCGGNILQDLRNTSVGWLRSCCRWQWCGCHLRSGCGRCHGSICALCFHWHSCGCRCIGRCISCSSSSSCCTYSHACGSCCSCGRCGHACGSCCCCACRHSCGGCRHGIGCGPSHGCGSCSCCCACGHACSTHLGGHSAWHVCCSCCHCFCGWSCC
mmetsp:Transcript_50988/g.94277  ORF Transcript_50988/g.94277 Transcript_50988/m.94277 type:complete len:237 (-) Transcript_50988:335-1045(-)